jgi:hypothetical protein
VTELEDKLMSNNKDLHAAQDLNQALQHEFKVSIVTNLVQKTFRTRKLPVKRNVKLFFASLKG